MNIEIRPLYPQFAAEVGGIDLARPLDAAAVDAIWRAIDRYAVLVFRDQRLDRHAVARFRRAVRPARNRPGGGGRRQAASRASRRSATSRTSTRTGGCAPATTGAGSTASATGCGTPTPPTCRCRWCWGCCTRSRCRRRARSAAARPSSPICAPPTTRCREAMQRDDRRPRRRARHLLVARPDRLYRISRPASARNTRRRGSAWCAGIPARGARRSICRRTPRTSSAGRLPRAACCCCDLNTHATQRRVRLQPQMAGRRSGDLGQSLHDASRPPARRDPAARPAPRDDARYRLDPRRGRLSLRRIARFSIPRASLRKEPETMNGGRLILRFG